MNVEALLDELMPLVEGKKEECGALIHTRGWIGALGPITCANKKPCQFHPREEIVQATEHTIEQYSKTFKDLAKDNLPTQNKENHILTSPHPLEEGLRKEFGEECFCTEESLKVATFACKYNKDEVADWWLSKFSQTLAQEREKVVKTIEREIKDWQKGDHHTNIAGGAIAALRSLLTDLSANPKSND